jgi:hypothetical protein
MSEANLDIRWQGGQYRGVETDKVLEQMASSSFAACSLPSRVRLGPKKGGIAGLPRALIPKFCWIGWLLDSSELDVYTFGK